MHALHSLTTHCRIFLTVNIYLFVQLKISFKRRFWEILHGERLVRVIYQHLPIVHHFLLSDVNLNRTAVKNLTSVAALF